MSAESARQNPVESASHQAWRRMKDRAARVVVVLGGLSVIFAVLLIMFYLVWVVLPLFVPADVEYSHGIEAPATYEAVAHMATEEQGEIAVQFTDSGVARFLRITDGHEIKREELRSGIAASSFVSIDPLEAIVAYGYADGQALLAKHAYRITYPNDVRHIDPQIEYPLGEDAIEIDPAGRPLQKLAVSYQEERLLLVAQVGESILQVAEYEMEENFLSGELELSLDNSYELPVGVEIAHLLLDPLGQWLYAANETGDLEFYQLNRSKPRLNQKIDLADNGKQLTSLELLMGGISLLAGQSDGAIVQWFPVRDEENNYQIHRVRDFKLGDAAVRSINIEQRRKGFVAVDEAGTAAIFYTTSDRRVADFEIAESDLADAVKLAVSPRAEQLLALSSTGEIAIWSVENHHPETSWSSLWGKVWYEGYKEPEYIWQSSAANTDFEPKFSLTPLAFGTLKAAFYAMLLALPLAIAGATYTAYFMSPGLRRKVKPIIEIMEALPTVILGFLAGLWLAPIFEAQLAGIFMLVILMPVVLLSFGYAWNNAPESIRLKVADGWEPILLIPVVIGTCVIAFMLDDPIERALFAGNMPQFLTNEWGIDFDQRNSIVVGFAMGFAVIPTIFSITEDAVFGVPKHLINGSLALGATPWQTLVRVVMPTASPGIFSAVMIGMGRAVGETMIVLMATGNTPVMDWNIFEGMRTLSANIAVEMPESEVGSSHYRILFLAGLVLFIFTFVVNTMAEVIRQRLRTRYSNL